MYSYNSNGFIFSTVDTIIKVAYWLNLVEYFKRAAKFFISTNSLREERIRACNNAIDLFIVFKWLLIFHFWVLNLNNELVIYTTWYFIITNTYTYFYYHVWGDHRFSNHFSEDRVKRRFLNAVLAIAYYIFCFAYLYSTAGEIAFAQSQFIHWYDYIYYSICVALTCSLGDLTPNGAVARFISSAELINTFIFITIIISNSIPSPVQNGEKE